MFSWSDIGQRWATCNRPEIDPVAAKGLERSCPPAWHIEGSGLSTKHAAS